nr:Coenzyme F420 hydrogenase/dehydrogenase, beta subunit C-terminal domain [uncultured Methanobacterium sp.]
MITKLTEVIDSGLCCNCGTCEGICPNNAVELQIDHLKKEYVPVVDEIKCNNCNKCYNVCPGHSVNYNELNEFFFNKKPEDILMGNYLNCYVGYVNNENIRFNSSSGGLVTGILVYALDKGIIDGALVTRMSKENPLEPEPFIARTPEEIIEASKSKYCPVPVNKVIKEILHSKDDKLAVVGLPCHIHGIRNAEMMNKTLREKIVLHLGIFCSHTDTFWQTDSLLSKWGIGPKEVQEINYRGDGWPGNMTITLKNGKRKSIPYSEAISQHNLWVNALFRCLFCPDLTAEMSDMSFGDPWIPEIIEAENKGQSIVVSRTENSENILTEVVVEGYIQLDDLSAGLVKKSGHMMESKKKDVKTRFLIRRMFRKEIPYYEIELQKPSFKNYLRAIFVYFQVVLSSKRSLRFWMVKLSELEIKLFKTSGGNR